MRTPADRVRHLLLFEVSALAILVPIGTIFFGFDPLNIGSLGITTATIAAVWNYLYNWGFDHALKRLTGSVGNPPTKASHSEVEFSHGEVL